MEGRKVTDQPRTIAEQLDAAPDGKRFGEVLNNLFSALETAMDKQEAQAQAGPDETPPRCQQCGADFCG